MSEETQEQETTEEPKMDFDPKAVEQELIRQAEERAQDPTETAAGAYQMYVPHFKAGLSRLSTRGLRRVLQYMVLYPLEKESVNAASEFEKQFMQLTNSLVEAKFVMLMDSYRQHAEALYNAQNADLTPEEEAGVIEELRKGGVSEEEIEKLVKAHKEK